VKKPRLVPLAVDCEFSVLASILGRLVKVMSVSGSRGDLATGNHLVVVFGTAYSHLLAIDNEALVEGDPLLELASHGAVVLSDG
jgi:hypothetical protein